MTDTPFYVIYKPDNAHNHSAKHNQHNGQTLILVTKLDITGFAVHDLCLSVQSSANKCRIREIFSLLCFNQQQVGAIVSNKKISGSAARCLPQGTHVSLLAICVCMHFVSCLLLSLVIHIMTSQSFQCDQATVYSLSWIAFHLNLVVPGKKQNMIAVKFVSCKWVR